MSLNKQGRKRGKEKDFGDGVILNLIVRMQLCLGQSTVIFAVATAAISFIMWKIDVQIYGELIGLAALLTEVTLP